MMQGWLITSFVWWLRITLSRLLFVLFGLFLPALDSARSIINNDAESIREFLTYWCVLGIVLYLEASLNMFSALKNWPPESKVMFTLWLTLPQFQGAFRIYSYILQPLFEKHEDQIDKHLSVLGLEVRQKANRQLQTILWQLFLSPNDGLLAGALSANSVITSWVGAAADNHNTASSLPPPPSIKESLSQQLLASFTQYLNDGLYADVCLATGHSLDDFMNLDTTSTTMTLCRISLLGSCYLKVARNTEESNCGESFCTMAAAEKPLPESLRSDKAEDGAWLDLEEVDLLVPSSVAVVAPPPSTRIGGWGVRSVSLSLHDPNLVVLAYTQTQTQTRDSSSRKQHVAYVKAADSTESDAILAGMTVVIADIKKKCSSRIGNALVVLQKLHALCFLTHAFSNWKQYSLKSI